MYYVINLTVREVLSFLFLLFLEWRIDDQIVKLWAASKYVKSIGR